MPITRRSFLKLCASGAAGLALTPVQIHLPAAEMDLARVAADWVYVYEQPSFQSKRLVLRQRDDLVHIYYQLEVGSGINPLWYRIWGGYIHSGHLQRVKSSLNQPQSSIPNGGWPFQVTVPYTRAARQNANDIWQPINRLYCDTVHWVTAVEDGPDGLPWYRIVDIFDRVYHAPAAHLRPIQAEEVAPIARDVPSKDKYIEVSIGQQTLKAYQSGQIVRETKISSGTKQSGELQPGDIPTDTLIGDFHITVKTPSRHMGDKKFSSELLSGALIGVPWVSFFHQTGLSLHGTFWHNNFGMRMSHGCINLPNEDALWVYRWTVPSVAPAERQASEWGTRVSIRE